MRLTPRAPRYSWRVEGYAAGDSCQRHVGAPSLLAAVWRYVMWGMGGVRWDELRLVREPPNEHPGPPPHQLVDQRRGPR